MGFIIIGIVLAIVIFIVGVQRGWSANSSSTLCAIAVCFFVWLGLRIPGRDIGREFFSQTELVSLSDGMSVSGRGGLFYVRVDSKNSYSYYYEIDSDYKQTSQEKSYKQGTVTGNDVIIIEYENMEAEIPTLYVYHTGHVRNFWTFSLDGDKYECIIFGTPVWASSFTPPIRTFIKENKEKINGKKIAVFICYMGGGADKAIEKLKQCLEINDLKAELILIDPKDKKSDEKDKQIEEFCEKIKDN